MGDDRLPGIGSSAVAGIRALRKSQSNQPNRGPG
jgi:Sec-independent protein translocase protein TatA